MLTEAFKLLVNLQGQLFEVDTKQMWILSSVMLTGFNCHGFEEQKYEI